MFNEDEIVKRVEAILFVAGEPIEMAVLADTLLVNIDDFKIIMEKYAKSLLDNDRGIKIVRLENRLQMITNEKYFDVIEKIFKKKAIPKLSESALETLAIISFRQPISKSEISRIRGVNSDYNVNRLMEFNIVCEVGRADTPGRPILLGTTDEFLKYYGINSVDEFRYQSQLKLDELID